MKDYNEIYRSLKYPSKPKKNPPVREDFPNNTAWGVALDAYDVQFAQEQEDFKNAMDAYHEESRRIDTEFWNDLYAELGWDKLPVKVSAALQSHAWNLGHSAGYMEVFNYASDFGDIVDAVSDSLSNKE